MRSAPELRLLLPTDFSDVCTQVGRAVEQLARAYPVSATIVHVARPGEPSAKARRSLESFLSRSNHDYPRRRVLVEGLDAAASVAALCDGNRFDLVMAPASRRGWVQFGASFRTRLLRRTHVPLWTVGHGTPLAVFRQPIRTIACLIDFDDHPDSTLRAVSAFADPFGARVVLMAVVPPLHDGTIANLATSKAPLTVARTQNRIAALLGEHGHCDVRVGVGERGPELRRMLGRGDVDLLFVGRRQATQGSFGFRLPRDLDRLPCPVVCLDGSAIASTGWLPAQSQRLGASLPHVAAAPALVAH